MTLSVTTVTDGDDAALVVVRLEEAGATLLALPGSGYTTGMRCGMPEVIHDVREAYGWLSARVRPPIPSAQKIDRMEEAWGWLKYIPADRYVLRKIVGARCLVHPTTDRHLFSWPRVATAVGADRRAVQNWHAEAIGLIVAELHRRGFIFFP